MVVLPELEVKGKLDVYRFYMITFLQENSPLG